MSFSPEYACGVLLDFHEYPCVVPVRYVKVSRSGDYTMDKGNMKVRKIPKSFLISKNRGRSLIFCVDNPIVQKRCGNFEGMIVVPKTLDDQEGHLYTLNRV